MFIAIYVNAFSEILVTVWIPSLMRKIGKIWICRFKVSCELKREIFVAIEKWVSLHEKLFKWSITCVIRIDRWICRKNDVDVFVGMFHQWKYVFIENLILLKSTMNVLSLIQLLILIELETFSFLSLSL